jgi:hypothetical protein
MDCSPLPNSDVGDLKPTLSVVGPAADADGEVAVIA